MQGESTMPSPSDVVDSLASQLLSSRLSQSEEEARCVAEACLVVDDDKGSEGHPSDGKGPEDGAVSACADALREYFPDLADEEALSIAKKSFGMDDNETGQSSESEEGKGNKNGEKSLGDSSDDDDDDEDDGNYIGEGECELCERTIRLTRHHLVPKSTWPKMRKRLLRAADAIESGDAERTRKLLGGADLPGLGGGREVTRDVVRGVLRRTCDICRPCHDAVHRLHGEMELAEHYNTVEKLLTDEGIVKFCRWANKQRPGKYAV